MIPETPLLTIEQRKRLITRDEKKESELDAYKKRHNDQVVLKKFGDYIESIPDVLLILKHMPPEKIAKKLQLAQVPAMLDLIETLLQKVDPWPVVERKDIGFAAYKTAAAQGSNLKPGECYIGTMAWSASDEEIAVNKRLKEHLDTIQHYVDPYLVDPVCHKPKYEILPAAEIMKALRAGERSGFLSISYFRSWADEKGIVYREPVIVKEDELKFKRWNPKGLPRKYDVPEQPKEPPA